jgi:hypothetical protein
LYSCYICLGKHLDETEMNGVIKHAKRSLLDYFRVHNHERFRCNCVPKLP